MYIIEGILGIVLLFYGLKFFIQDTQNIGIIIAVGMLTFVAVFFSFVHTSEKFSIPFRKFIETSIIEIKKNAHKKIDKGELDNLSDLSDEFNSIKTLEKEVNPELWLYMSVFSYLISIVAGLVPNVSYFNNLFTTRHVQGILFYLGLIFTFFLVTSLACLAIISKHNPKIKKLKK